MQDDHDDTDLQNLIESNADSADSELTKLPGEDNPQSGPDDATKQLDDTHPVTDSNIEASEEYDEGLSGAAEAEDPDGASIKTNEKPPAWRGLRFRPT